MLAALRTLAECEPSSQALLEKTAQYLEACHLIFERGILSHKLVKSSDCQLIANIKEGFQFFQEWCYEHENKGASIVVLAEIMIFMLKCIRVSFLINGI